MKTVVEMVTACVAPAVVGVMLNDSRLADRPVTAGTETVQVTDAAEPLVRVATTLGVVLEPAATVALVGLQATV